MSRELEALRDWFAAQPDGILAEQRELMLAELDESGSDIEASIIREQLDVCEAVLASRKSLVVIELPRRPGKRA